MCVLERARGDHPRRSDVESPAQVAPKRLWKDAVDRASGDVVALKVVKAAASTHEDLDDDGDDDVLSSPRCAMTLVSRAAGARSRNAPAPSRFEARSPRRLAARPETDKGRVALDALSLLLQSHGLRSVAAKRALRKSGRRDGQGRKRVIQRRFNVGVLEAVSKRKASTL